MARNKFFFPLTDAYYYGRRLNTELRERLGDKLVQDKHATGLLAQAIFYSGDGEYIEIGSLHGGSAITAALIKKKFNLKGNITCIEPKPRKILENAKIFGVENKIQIITNPSSQVEIDSTSNISCGFIDGDHRYSHPLHDWRKLSKIVSRYIIFDDYDKSEEGVVWAVKSIHPDEPWYPVHISNAIAIFENYEYKSIQE